jgi:hypothetical protein
MLRVVDVASAGAAIVAAAGCWRAVAVRAMLEVCDMRSICDAMDGRSAMRAGGRAARVLDQAGRQAGRQVSRRRIGRHRQTGTYALAEDDDAFAGAERWSMCGYAVCGRGAALARLSACLLDLSSCSLTNAAGA